MSLNEAIDELINATLTIERRDVAVSVHGIFQSVTPTVFTCDVVIQPAYNINRVVGGADLHAHVDNQTTTTVYQIHTRTELFTRTPAHEPDVIVGYKGANWTVIRVEEWDNDGEIHYHCIITKSTLGAS